MKGFIRGHELCGPGDSVVVALSGGQDSVCLLHLFKCLSISWGIKLYAVHFEHGLRGEESLRDASFAHDLAMTWKVVFFQGNGDTGALAREKRISSQEAARILRYKFFHEIVEKTGADWIATAHTATDQAEEVLIRLVRGAGASGLSGIPVKNDRIIRPLLWAERDEITQYLKRRSIPFVTDSSNLGRRYLRNRIRSELIPFLRENYNPSIIRTLNRSAELLMIEDRAMEKMASEVFDRVCHRTGHGKDAVLTIRCPDILLEDEAIRRRVMLKFLMASGVPGERISASHIKSINGIMVNPDKGIKKLHLPSNLILCYKNGSIYCMKARGKNPCRSGNLHEQ